MVTFRVLPCGALPARCRGTGEVFARGRLPRGSAVTSRCHPSGGEAPARGGGCRGQQPGIRKLKCSSRGYRRCGLIFVT